MLTGRHKGLVPSCLSPGHRARGRGHVAALRSSRWMILTCREKQRPQASQEQRLPLFPFPQRRPGAPAPPHTHTCPCSVPSAGTQSAQLAPLSVVRRPRLAGLVSEASTVETQLCPLIPFVDSWGDSSSAATLGPTSTERVHYSSLL